jgi:hypothetical protein
MMLALAHAMAAERTDRLSKWLGVPVVILTSIVGTSVFASLTDLGKAHVSIAVMAGVLSILAAVLAALQTFLNFGDRAEAHSKAGARFHAVCTSLERLLVRNIDDKALHSRLQTLDKEFAKILEESPRVSLALQKKASESNFHSDYTRQGHLRARSYGKYWLEQLSEKR